MSDSWDDYAEEWDTNSDERSYKMDIATTSDSFGDGSDGALTIATNTTEAPIDSTAAGTIFAGGTGLRCIASVLSSGARREY